MAKLVEFLHALGSDAALADQFANDPEGVATTYGLDADATAAVVAGDTDKIRALSGLSHVAVTHRVIKAY